ATLRARPNPRAAPYGTAPRPRARSRQVGTVGDYARLRRHDTGRYPRSCERPEGAWQLRLGSSWTPRGTGLTDRRSYFVTSRTRLVLHQQGDFQSIDQRTGRSIRFQITLALLETEARVRCFACCAARSPRCSRIPPCGRASAYAGKRAPRPRLRSLL